LHVRDEKPWQRKEAYAFQNTLPRWCIIAIFSMGVKLPLGGWFVNTSFNLDVVPSYNVSTLDM